MKKPGLVMVGITCVFLCVLLGIFVGRNFTGSYRRLETVPDASVGQVETPSDSPVRLDLNTATPEQLQLLPGIGQTIAQRIVDYRTLHNGFGSVEELMNVDGIGEKKFSQLEPYLTTGGNYENSGG